MAARQWNPARRLVSRVRARHHDQPSIMFHGLWLLCRQKRWRSGPLRSPQAGPGAAAMLGASDCKLELEIPKRCTEWLPLTAQSLTAAGLRFGVGPVRHSQLKRRAHRSRFCVLAVCYGIFGAPPPVPGSVTGDSECQHSSSPQQAPASTPGAATPSS